MEQKEIFIKKKEEKELKQDLERQQLFFPLEEQDKRANVFFDEILVFIRKNRGIEKTDVAFLLVNHIVSTLPPFLCAIQQIGRIALIIPKGSCKDSAILEHVQKVYGAVFFSRQNCNLKKYIQEKYIGKGMNSRDREAINYREILKNDAINIIKDVLQGENQKFLIIDIGGYFAFSLKDIYSEFKDQFLGIVEDTENGHQKYEEMIEWLKNGNKLTECPIISVARCELKKTEDYNVGKSIVQAVDTMLRTKIGIALVNMKIIGVMGFGKIGKSIAEHLKQQQIRRVIVFDKKLTRMMEAVSLGFEIANRKKLLSACSMLFCATGNKSLEGYDFFNLRNDVFIASCTSSEDEFDFTLFHKKAEETIPKSKLDAESNIDKYKLDGKTINLLHGGNAVNFVYGAVNGPYIYSVQASLLLVAANLIVHKQYNLGVIQPMLDDDMEDIAYIWLKVFEKYFHEDSYIINDSDWLNQLFRNKQKSKSEHLEDSENMAYVYLIFVIDFLKNKDRVGMKSLIKFLYQSAATAAINLNSKIISNYLDKIKRSKDFKELFNYNEREIIPFGRIQDEQNACLKVIGEYANVKYLQPFIFHLCRKNIHETSSSPLQVAFMLYWINIYYAQGSQNYEHLNYYLLLLSLQVNDLRQLIIEDEKYRLVMRQVVVEIKKDEKVDREIFDNLMFNDFFSEYKSFQYT